MSRDGAPTESAHTPTQRELSPAERAIADVRRELGEKADRELDRMFGTPEEVEKVAERETRAGATSGQLPEDWTEEEEANLQRKLAGETVNPMRDTNEVRAFESPDPLICLLYLLGRDHLPLGEIETALGQAVDTPNVSSPTIFRRTPGRGSRRVG